MYKIAFVTGSRADYGIMRRYLELLNKDKNIDLSILVTGALLDDKYGHQVNLIERDGFKIAVKIKTNIDTSSNKAIIDNMAETLSLFGEYFSMNAYDMLIILGDRYEMLSVATAAAMQRVPILHIHGGEATYGNYDEFIRHCITKMSLYHYTSTSEYRNRVIQLGEQPQNVFYVGALGAENCLFIDETNVPDEVKNLETKKYFVVLFHPETLTDVDVIEQMHELLDAIDEYLEYDYVFLGTNADTYADKIRNEVKKYVENHSNTLYFENLHTDAYHYLLKNGIALIGNSSSGIIEAPSLGIYTINIGDRQSGRVRGNSVIDIKCSKECIVNAMHNVTDNYKDIKPINPYYKENTADVYYDTTIKLLGRLKEDMGQPKVFYDLT